MKKRTNAIEKTFLYAWPFMASFALVSYLISMDVDIMLSFLLGAFSSLLMNSLQYRVMKNAYKNQPETIKTLQIVTYAVKYIFYALILYIAYTSQGAWNIYLVFVGLFTYVIVLIPVSLITAWQDGKENGIDNHSMKNGDGDDA